MINEYFKISDTHESVLDSDQILKVELKNDSVQSFNARWDEITIAMKMQPDEDFSGEIMLSSGTTVRTATAIFYCRCTFKMVFRR